MTTEKLQGIVWHYERASTDAYLRVSSTRIVWHLWDASGDYRGNFATKRALYDYIAADKYPGNK